MIQTILDNDIYFWSLISFLILVAYLILVDYIKNRLKNKDKNKW